MPKIDFALERITSHRDPETQRNVHFFSLRLRDSARVLLMVCFLTFALPCAAYAQLAGVSGFQTGNPASDIVGAGGNPAQVSRSLAHGFPLWYQDAVSGKKIAPCLDFLPVIDAPANVDDPGELLTLRAVNAFCFAEAFFDPGRPLSFNGGSFPENFPELFPWYRLEAAKGLDLDGDGVQETFVLAEMAFLGGFVNELPTDGEQVMINESLIRLINLPTGAGYRVTTPYGAYTFDIVGPDVRIVQTVNTLIGGDFLGVLAPPGPAQAIRDALNLTTDAGTGVNEFFAWRPAQITAYDAAFLGAFPIAGAAPPTPGVQAGGLDQIFRPVLDLNGVEAARQLYTSMGQLRPDVVPLPANFTAPAEQPVVNQAGVAQQVQVIPPATIDLGNGPGVALILDTFSLQGKLFNDGPNVAPTAVADTGIVSAIGASGLLLSPLAALLDVTANDLDPVSGANVHGIHPQAVALMDFDPARLAVPQPDITFSGLPSDVNGNLVLASRVATERGGTVQRSIDNFTGQTRFLYTPPAGPAPGQPFTGNDRFIYAVQDTGGLISKAAAVTVAVEGLQMQAHFRGKIGKWRISGTSTNPAVPDPLSPGQNIPNTIAIFQGATIPAGALPAAAAIVQPDGTWIFEGKLAVSPGVGSVSCRSANGTVLLGVPVTLR